MIFYQNSSISSTLQSSVDLLTMPAYPPYASVSDDTKECDLSLSSSSSNESSVSNYYSSSNAATKYLFLDTESEHDFEAKDTEAESSPPLLTLPLEGTDLSQGANPPLAPSIALGLALQPLLCELLSALCMRL